MNSKIKIDLTESELRSIVNSELRRNFGINETIDDPNVDHKWIKDIVTAASRMLSTIEDFEKILAPHGGIPSAGPITSAVSEPLSSLKEILVDMVENPTSYIPTEVEGERIEEPGGEIIAPPSSNEKKSEKTSHDVEPSGPSEPEEK